MKFSILIPAYKTLYLSKAIDSCLKQNYSDYEIIIVDDFSPHDIKDIVDKYDDCRIRYYRNEKNCGAIDVINNWNICLGYAKGDWIICMGDDDMLTPDALSEYFKLIEKYPDVTLLHGRSILIDDNDEPFNVTTDRAEYESCISFIHHRFSGRLQYIGDFCFKREKLRELGGFYYLPLAWGADDISAFICAENGVANSNIPTFLYRVNRFSISTLGNIGIKLEAIIKEEQWYTNFINKTQPPNLIDKLILDDIKKNLSKFFAKKRARTIGDDMASNFIHLFKWIWYSKKYKINSVSIILGIFEALKKQY